MIDAEERSLTLFARLPFAVRSRAGANNDPGAAPFSRGVFAGGRLHVTLAVLDGIDAPFDQVVWLIRWIFSTIPPFAFRLAFDELVVGSRSTLLKANAPLEGLVACRAHIAEMLAGYGVTLPGDAPPGTEVTLGYGDRGVGRSGIDRGHWLIDELALVCSSPAGNAVLGEWRLPLAFEPVRRCG